VTTPFSAELRRLRKQARLSQSVLAARATLSTEAISLLERGRRSPRTTTIRLLADALRLSPAERSTLFSAPLSAPTRSHHPFPRYGNALVGRVVELGEARQLLTSSPTRLLTLTGPGGVGKTRLAAETVNQGPASWPGGVGWVDVMACEDPAQLALAVATALGTTSLDEPDLHTGVTDASLLVLDGAEEMLDDVAEMCGRLLAATTLLRIVVTSRERLHLGGEVILVVAPLACAEVTPEADTVLWDFPATRLFLDRMPWTVGRRDQAAGLSAAELGAVARICARLDGVPLAIELAAGRTALLTIAELAAALDRDLGYLYVPRADDEVMLREVMVAESFPRLSAPEQELLARLSLFSDSFTTRSVAAVCGELTADDTCLDTLSLLVSKSLVLRGGDVAGTATYRLLRVVREFAADRLERDPARLEVHRRYAGYFRDLAASAAPHLVGGAEDQWSRTLDTEADNLRQAFRWLLQHDPASALAMVGSLAGWWHLRGLYREGRTAGAAALARTTTAPASLRAAGFTATGLLALLQCDYEAAQADIQQGLDLYSSVQDKAGLRRSLALLGEVAVQRGEYTVAGQLHEQALVLARRAADTAGMGEQLNFLAEALWLRGDFHRSSDRAQRALEILSGLADQQGVVLALVNLGAAARYRGDLVGARTLLTSSLHRSERISYREGVAWALNQLGVVSRLEGDRLGARAQQTRSLAEHRALDNHWRAASVLDELAALALDDGDAEQCTAQLAAATQLRQKINAPVPSAEQPARDRTVAAVRALVGPAVPALSLAGTTCYY
jgi:predicted ATPase/DNA-binding XRE family transcriptional regulator